MNKEEIKKKLCEAIDNEEAIATVYFSIVNEKNELRAISKGKIEDVMEIGLGIIFDMMHKMNDFGEAKKLVLTSIIQMQQREKKGADTNEQVG